MIWHDMPPLAALRAFSAFAETGNVVQAGEALNVTHAAISQQLRALERHMGVTLFDRSGRALELTAEGAQLARALADGFGTIAETVTTLTDAEADRPLHVSTTPMFASAWLMPQLARFHAANPGFELILSTTPEIQPLSAGGIDLALRYGTGTWPGVRSEMLFSSPMVVVAAPKLVGDRTFGSVEELAGYPWLLDVGVSEANQWIAGALRPGATTLQLPGNLLLDGARDGQGVVVSIRNFVEPDIRAGRLRVLLEHPEPRAYFIVTRPEGTRKAARKFVAWLRRAAG